VSDERQAGKALKNLMSPTSTIVLHGSLGFYSTRKFELGNG